MGDELLGDLCHRILVGSLLLQIYELLRESIEAAVQFAGGDGFPGAPRQGLVELQLDEASFLVLRLLLVDRMRTSTRRHVARNVCHRSVLSSRIGGCGAEFRLGVGQLVSFTHPFLVDSARAR